MKNKTKLPKDYVLPLRESLETLLKNITPLPWFVQGGTTWASGKQPTDDEYLSILLADREQLGTSPVERDYNQIYATHAANMLPELLRQLERAERFMVGFEDDTDCNPQVKGWLKEIRAALAQAKNAPPFQDQNLPDPKSKPRVIVTIDGGCIEEITVSEPMEVLFFDWDSINGGDAERYLEKEYAEFSSPILRGQQFDAEVESIFNRIREIKKRDDDLLKQSSEQQSQEGGETK